MTPAPLLDWLSRRFELSRGGASANLRPMEGLRGFAVFLVFLVHYVSLGAPWIEGHDGLRTFADGVHRIGNTGVDLFFVLSGYLIYGSLMLRPQPFLPYMARRAERIYPAFLAVLALYIALSFAMPAASRIPREAADAALYLVENLLLLPGLAPIEPIITVAWSLSYEMFFYLTVPALIGGLRLRRWTAGQRMALFGAASCALAAYCALNGGHVRLIMFFSGMLLWEVLRVRQAAAPRAGSALLALAAAWSLVALPLKGSAWHAAEVVALALAYLVLCLACFAAPASRTARAFSWTPLRWLGNMSYSYYLLHGLALHGAFRILGLVAAPAGHGAAFAVLLMPALFAASLVPAALLFLAVERPLSLAAQPRRQAGLSGGVRRA